MSAVTGGSVNSVVAAASSLMTSDCVRLVAVGASFTALTVMLMVPVGFVPCGPAGAVIDGDADAGRAVEIVGGIVGHRRQRGIHRRLRSR